MGYGAVSDTVVSGWLADLQARARYASVHFSVPNWVDPGSSEAFDPGYARQLLFWAVESTRGITTAQPLVFPALGAMTVAAVGLWTEATGGQLVGYCVAAAGSEAYMSSAGTWTLPAGELAIRL
jgi:hypothetical protein